MATAPTTPRQQRLSGRSGQTKQKVSPALLPFLVDLQSMTVLPMVAVPKALGGKAALRVHFVQVGRKGLPLNAPGRGAPGFDFDLVILDEANKHVTAGDVLTGKHKGHVLKVKGGGAADFALADSPSSNTLRAVVEKTLESVREVGLRSGMHQAQTEFIRAVAKTLADKAGVPEQAVSVEEGWQQLLEAGLRSKAALLGSTQFKSTAEASGLLGIGEPAVRKRIREGKLFALKTPGDEHRIPGWALDAKITGPVTVTLLEDGSNADEWRLYHALSTPNGSLNGLRPFECLMASDCLPPSRRAARAELLRHLKLPIQASLLEPVRQALKTELADDQGP